jgi:hypothetical protein
VICCGFAEQNHHGRKDSGREIFRLRQPPLKMTQGAKPQHANAITDGKLT